MTKSTILQLFSSHNCSSQLCFVLELFCSFVLLFLSCFVLEFWYCCSCRCCGVSAPYRSTLRSATTSSSSGRRASRSHIRVSTCAKSSSVSACSNSAYSRPANSCAPAARRPLSDRSRTNRRRVRKPRRIRPICLHNRSAYRSRIRSMRTARCAISATSFSNETMRSVSFQFK